MPKAAEKTPIVPMNSFTGMPLRTWMFLNTCSAMGGPAGAACPLVNTTLDSHSAHTPATTLTELRFMAIVLALVKWDYTTAHLIHSGGGWP
jgi:hypothetical protein